MQCEICRRRQRRRLSHVALSCPCPKQISLPVAWRMDGMSSKCRAIEKNVVGGRQEKEVERESIYGVRVGKRAGVQKSGESGKERDP